MVHKVRQSALISQTAEYALCAVVHIAESGGGPLTTRAISRAMNIPAGYLSKVLRTLANGNIVSAQRGVGGGFTLNAPPKDLTLSDILKCVDGGMSRMLECPLGIPEHTSLCAVHTLLDNAAAQIESILNSTTIADLLDATLSDNGTINRCSEAPIQTYSNKVKPPNCQ